MARQNMTNRMEPELKIQASNLFKSLGMDLSTATCIFYKQALPPAYKDHCLTNSRNFKNVRECHIKPDWLLVYRIVKNALILELIRTGSHSDLF